MKRAASTVLAVAAAFAIALPARAEKPRCRLERLDPKLADERLVLYASVLELEGGVVEGMNTGQFVLRVDGKPAGKAEKVQKFAGTKEEVDVALVVEVGVQYKKAFDQVREALKDFLSEQPPSMKVMLIPFGSDISKVRPKFSGAPMMAVDLDDLSPDDDSADIRMGDAIRLAMGELKKLDPKEEGQIGPRRLIVLVSDGLNAKMDRATFKKLGDDAAKAGMPIHTIAYSPIDERGPLLNLGELSKRSNGTFRWAQKADSLKEQLDNLADEVRKQYVLTFKTSLSSTEKHSFSVQCGELRSNPLGGKGKFGQVLVVRSGMAWYWWLLTGIVTLLGGVFLLGLFLQWREKRAGAPAQPGAPKVAKPPKAAKPVKPGAVQARPQVQTPGRAPSGRSAVLTAVSGGMAGRRFPIAPSLTIGKAQHHSLPVLDDPTVSTNHCEIRVEGQGILLRDLGSTNGTFLNGARITAPQWVNDGDLIRCGLNTQFKLRME